MTTPAGLFGLIDWTALPLPRTVQALYQSTSAQLVTGAGIITALSVVTRTASTAYLARLLDGTDTTGEMRVAVAAPAAGGGCLTPAPPGIPFSNGIYFHNLSVGADSVITYVPLLSYQ